MRKFGTPKNPPLLKKNNNIEYVYKDNRNYLTNKTKIEFRNIKYSFTNISID